MTKKIILFNHKGGVSKTTTTYHISWMLAMQGHRVLLVDADPQCNLTALMFNSNEEFEEYYEKEDTKQHNIKDGVKVAFEGKPYPIQAVNCIESSSNKNLFVLAGNPDLSEYDSSLSFAQTSGGSLYTLQNLPGAFNELINLTAAKYNVEYVLIDLNPGLSAINQNLFSLCNYFLVPSNPDTFSVMAINTLSNVLPRWVSWMEQMRPVFENSSYPLATTTPKLLGFIIQRFNVRNGKAAKPFRDYMQDVEDAIVNRLVPALRKKQMLLDQSDYSNANLAANYCIAEIPDFQSLIQKANDANLPVFALNDEQLSASGLVLNNLQASREKFNDIFSNIVSKIISMSSHYESSPHTV